MAAGDFTTQSLVSTASEYQSGFLARAISTVTAKIFCSYITVRKPAVMSAARRSSLAAADVTTGAFSTYSGFAIDCGQMVTVEAHCRFSAASQSATIFLILFDGAGSVMGHTPDITFQGEAAYTVDGTLFGSPENEFKLRGASSYYPILRTAPASGTVNIYCEHI